MKTSQQELYQEEIARCRRLYRGFENLEPFLLEAFQAVFSFIESYEEREGILEKVNFDKRKAWSRLKNGESMEINPTIQTRALVGILNELGQAVVRISPEIKDSITNFQKILENFQEKSKERVLKEEVWKLKELVVGEDILARDMATFIFTLALSAIYRFNLEAVSKGLRTDLWEGGNCALCGEKPHFGLLRSEDGAKIIECWLCGTQWNHIRIKCPYCSNTEQEQLGFFTVEENDSCRVQFCKKCSSYYKLFDTRSIAGENIVLSVHNLATLSYDILAREEGFKAGSGLEWVNEGEKLELDD